MGEGGSVPVKRGGGRLQEIERVTRRQGLPGQVGGGCFRNNLDKGRETRRCPKDGGGEVGFLACYKQMLLFFGKSHGGLKGDGEARLVSQSDLPVYCRRSSEGRVLRLASQVKSS